MHASRKTRTLARPALAPALLLAAMTAQAEPFGPLAPPNPALAATTGATMHGDSASSKVFPFAGPGRSVNVARTTLAATCPTILHGSDGYPVALCTDMLTRNPVAHLLNPATGASLASLPITRGMLLGGVYAYLDSANRLVLVDGNRDLLRIAHDRGSDGRWRLQVAQRVPLAAAIASDDGVTAISPDYSGRVWFATSAGTIGVVDTATGTTRTAKLPDGERIANSISTVPAGTAITSTHALYLFTANADGTPVLRWWQAYDRGTARKPGQLSWGSGSTPVFFGPVTGTEYVTITDNARPHMNLLVLRTDTGATVCTVPMFRERAASGTENANIAAGRSVFVVNTYGYNYPALPADAGPSVPSDAHFDGGVARVDVAEDGSGCFQRWSSRLRSAGLPRVSGVDGTLYTVEQHDLLNTEAAPYYYATVDATTGTLTSRTYLGLGLVNPLQMTGTVTPDGTLYQGVLTGLLRFSRK